MKRRLFLTGPIGCGKSTAIANALGEKITCCGGFLTRRHRDEVLSFTLESTDSKKCEIFLDFPDGQPRFHPEVFPQLGVELLAGKVLVLDEIGGVELLCSEFLTALNGVLDSDIPIIGVLKGEGPSGALVRKLGLSDEYNLAAARLRTYLLQDKNTLLYECGQYDENALRLAEQWAEEYLHE